MKIFRISLILFFFLIFVFSFGMVFAQTAKHTLEDYGLTQDDVKYLSQEEIKNIFNSKTPEETVAAEKLRIETSGTLEEKAALNNSKSSDFTSLEDTVDCFSYYNFGSIQTKLTAQNYYVNAGDEIKFSGPVINQNDYPIVNGTLYVKIFKTRSAIKEANGPDVVDQFIAADNITIPAKGKIPASFSWKLPSSSTEGEYRVVSFFTVDKKFNLLGLSFTDDVVGNTSNFKVTGQKTNVQFDKAGVMINDAPYFFAAFPPRVASKDPTVVLAKIDNTTVTDETVSIVWKLYKWDSINPANYIRTVSDKVTIKANSSTKIQITIPEAFDPVYYLVGELTYKDSKSILGIRFVRPEVDKIRLNFPSITSFPIKQGINSTMFSCLHNSGTSNSASDGKLTLKLTDTKGKIINEYTYSGPVTGEMMAVKNDFVSKTTIDHFFLTAQLWQADKLVDQSTLEYDCNKIDSKLCNPNSNWNIYMLLGMAVLFVVLACSVVVIFFKGKTKVKNEY